MEFFKELSKTLAEMTGIAATPILLTIYSIIALVIIGLLAKGIMFLNTTFYRDEKKLYLFNKKLKIVKVIIEIIVLLLIWEEQIHDFMTLISFVGAAATLAIKDIILNFLAGIYITVRKPFKIEDRIQINDIIGDVVNTNSLNFEILEVSQKEEGEQSTGIIVQIPNYKVFTDPIKNFTKAFKYIWSELEVNIKLDADLEHNKKVLYAIVKSNDIVKRIPKKMKDELSEVVGDYRIYYNNLEPIIYTKITTDYIVLTIRYLAHPKKARNIESQIWNTIYESAKEGQIDLYTTDEIKKKNK